MRVGYEEKSFEIYFNIDLEKMGGICFPFGQVQEGIVGADAAAMVHRKELITLLGMIPTAIKFGENITEICKAAEDFANKYINGDLPSMCANILFQYKRPTFVSNSRGTESAVWSSNPYYRYRIDTPKHQLERLLNIYSMYGGNCDIVYAAPAIKTANELYETHNNHRLIENTNYVLVDKLRGHSKYTYNSPGSHGIAFSDPEKIESPNINELIGSIRERRTDTEQYPHNERNVQLVTDLADCLRQAFVLQPLQNLRTNYSDDFLRREDYRNERMLPYPLVKSLLDVYAITTKYKFQWGLVLSERKH
jgi:hypothetical protein